MLAGRSSSDGRVAVLVWRHADDQYAEDDTAAAVDLQVTGLAPGRWTVRHWRIDRNHSNSHTVWQDLGAPQDPTPEQLATIMDRQGLEQVADDVHVTADGGALPLQVELPLPALSLLVLAPGARSFAAVAEAGHRSGHNRGPLRAPLPASAIRSTGHSPTARVLVGSSTRPEQRRQALPRAAVW